MLGSKTANSAARRLGYAHELAAIQARHVRCRHAWAPHLARTRKALLQSATPHASPRHSAVLLGAGLIQDIPLTELSALFGRIYLVDIAFSRRTRRLAYTWSGKLELVLSDLTGVCASIVAAKQIPAPKPSAMPFPYSVIDSAAWVASVNCLTQLPLLPVQWLIRRGFRDAEAEQFGQNLMQAHLHLLGSFQRPWCLITEMSDHRLDRHGRQLDETDYGPLLRPTLLGLGARQIDEWEWLAHPRGELPNGEIELRSITAWQRELTP